MEIPQAKLPNRFWTYLQPSETGEPTGYTLSEQEILDFYWECWCELMIKNGKQDLISPDLCIEDFVIVHWAMRTDRDGVYLNYGPGPPQCKRPISMTKATSAAANAPRFCLGWDFNKS